MEASVVTNPLLAMGGGGERTEGQSSGKDGITIDATTDEGVDALMSMGLPIKRI